MKLPNIRREQKSAQPAEKGELYGLLAKFAKPEDLIAATSRVYEAGYRQFDAHAPYPLEGLDEAMHLKSSPMPFVIFAGGVFGGLTGLIMQWFAQAVDYPLNIGGRPLFSWPAYIPITFELTILFGAFAGILGLFVITNFPQPYHPVFRSDDFNAHASSDGFYLGIQARDPKFDLNTTRRFLESLGSILVSEIEA